MSDLDTQTIIEYFDNKFVTLLENMDTTIDQKLAPISKEVDRIEANIAVIMQAVTATNLDAADQEVRTQKLEAAA
jgi:hypothetical protein